jgi:FKBP-type peptidyl-prolyl cis-trans isomerase 2
MNKARLGDTVAIHLTGTLADGTRFTDTDEEEALQFTLGENHVLPAVQQAVIGMGAGEAKIVAVPADNAYGPYRRELIRVVDRERLPKDLALKVGQRMNVRRSDGSLVPVTVAGFCEASVMLDANHPLAGKDLVFEILFLGIVRRGTPETPEASPVGTKGASQAHRGRQAARESGHSQASEAPEHDFDEPVVTTESGAALGSEDPHVPACPAID